MTMLMDNDSIAEDILSSEVRQSRYNAATERAMREARDIMAGKIQAESYDSTDALFAALDERRLKDAL